MPLTFFLDLVIIGCTFASACLIGLSTARMRKVFIEQNNINQVQHLRILALEQRLAAAGIPPLLHGEEDDAHAIH